MQRRDKGIKPTARNCAIKGALTRWNKAIFRCCRSVGVWMVLGTQAGRLHRRILRKKYFWRSAGNSSWHWICVVASNVWWRKVDIFSRQGVDKWITCSNGTTSFNRFSVLYCNYVGMLNFIFFTSPFNPELECMCMKFIFFIVVSVSFSSWFVLGGHCFGYFRFCNFSLNR